MIQRRPLEMKIHHERWLISYSDFITLLFAFFVVMYSISQVNEEKYKDLAHTLQSVFKEKSAQTGSTKAVDDNSSTAQGDIEILAQQMESHLAETPVGQTVRFSGNEEWIEIDIDSNLLFASGQATLNQEARDFFTQLAAMLAPFDNAITVSGHTDNVPIANARFADNWALSSARAVSVVALLAAHGVTPERLAAIGYGEYQPVADNGTEQGRALNRRVVLRIERFNSAPAIEPLDAVPSGTQENGVAIDSLPSQAVTPEETESEQQAQVRADGEVVEPIKLRNGGLLFTRDADSPRALQE